MTKILEDQERCPQCFRAPTLWRARPDHGAPQLYWIGCQDDGHLAGGLSLKAAIEAWNRMIVRVKANLDYKAA